MDGESVGIDKNDGEFQQLNTVKNPAGVYFMAKNQQPGKIQNRGGRKHIVSY